MEARWTKTRQLVLTLRAEHWVDRTPNKTQQKHVTCKTSGEKVPLADVLGSSGPRKAANWWKKDDLDGLPWSESVPPVDWRNRDRMPFNDIVSLSVSYWIDRLDQKSASKMTIFGFVSASSWLRLGSFRPDDTTRHTSGQQRPNERKLEKGPIEMSRHSHNGWPDWKTHHHDGGKKKRNTNNYFMWTWK